MPRKSKQIWIDADGDPRPVSLIDDQTRQRTVFVETCLRKAEFIARKLQSLQDYMAAGMNKFMQEAAERNGANWQGNTSLLNFTCNQKLQVTVGKYISFDERLLQAKTLINQCIAKWSDGSSEELVLLARKAFQVNQSGYVDTKLILMLAGIDMKDADWSRATDLIRQSITKQTAKQYTKFYKKLPSGKWKHIKLNWTQYSGDDEEDL